MQPTCRETPTWNGACYSMDSSIMEKKIRSSLNHLNYCKLSFLGVDATNREDIEWCTETSVMEKKIRGAAKCLFKSLNSTHAEVMSKADYVEAVKKLTGGDILEEKLLLAAGMDYKNLPLLCTRTGESTRVSKICSPRRGLPSHGCCKSLSLDLYKVVVYYFFLPLSIPVTNTLLLRSKTTSKRFLVRKRRQLGLIMASRHCLISDVTRCSLKRNCLYQGR